MSHNGTFRREGDRVVHAVLDEIHAETQIDPTSIVPDYDLRAEFGMTRVQMHTVLYRSARALGIPVTFESCRLEFGTARHMVDILKRWSCSTGQKAA